MSPMSCNIGLRSLPSMGISGSNRVKGLEVKSRNRQNPNISKAATATSLWWKCCSVLGARLMIKAVQTAIDTTQNSIEPSWEPQTAATLYKVAN